VDFSTTSLLWSYGQWLREPKDKLSPSCFIMFEYCVYMRIFLWKGAFPNKSHLELPQRSNRQWKSRNGTGTTLHTGGFQHADVWIAHFRVSERATHSRGRGSKKCTTVVHHTERIWEEPRIPSSAINSNNLALQRPTRPFFVHQDSMKKWRKGSWSTKGGTSPGTSLNGSRGSNWKMTP